MENKDGLCEVEVRKNLVLVELGEPLTLSLATLNRSCQFKKEWDKIQNKWNGRYNKYDKAKQKAYRQTPEFKAKQKAYQQTPEAKAKQKAYQQTPEFKAKQKAYYEKTKKKRNNR